MPSFEGMQIFLRTYKNKELHLNNPYNLVKKRFIN